MMLEPILRRPVPDALCLAQPPLWLPQSHSVSSLTPSLFGLPEFVADLDLVDHMLI